jgi:nucleoside-diphosphate-sugar epimerase
VNYTVLGATGFIGRHLVDALRSAGHAVYAPVKGAQDVLERPLGHVLYCIGLTADFRSRPFDTARAHVSVLADVLEKSDFESLLYLSSTRIYARSSTASETAALSFDVADPSDLYNVTKAAGESLCRSCGRTGVRIARLSNVIGHDTTSENFVSSLVREAISGRIELQSSPSSSKDYILLDDVVSLLPRIATEGREWIYNVASGANIHHQELVDRLVQLTGCETSVLPDAPTSSFPSIDTGRIRAEFGFSPSPVLDAIPGLVAAFRQSN